MSDINFNQKILCKNCTEDIFSVHTVLVRCTACPDLDLCPDCFAAGAHLGEHVPHHPYRIVDNGGFGLLGSNWSAREHIRLLDSVERYGFGNWDDISRQITTTNLPGVTRIPEEARVEFSNVFINGPLGRHTWNEDHRGRSRDHTQGNPLLPPSAPAEPLPSLTLTESIMLGYMPQRDDFEVEYDNEAESLVSQLHGSGHQLSSSSSSSNGGVGGTGGSNGGGEEEDVDVALKVAHVDMYKYKLRERERRKKVSRDHMLINQFFRENPVSGGLDRGRGGPGGSGGGGGLGSKASKRRDSRIELTERLKVLAEFQGVSEHQAFMASIVKEKELKNRVKDLLRFRKNGITQHKDSTEYEIQRLRRIKRRNELRKKFDLAGAAAGGGLLAELSSSSSPMAFKDEQQQLLSGGGGYGLAGSPVGSALSPSKSMAEPNSIIGLPGYEVLSSNERRLCSNLRLTPAHYVSYKTCLLANHLQKKKGQTPKPLNPDGLDKNNRKIILQFLIRCGWITAY